MTHKQTNFELDIYGLYDLIKAIPANDKEMKDYYLNKFASMCESIALDLINGDIFSPSDWQKMKKTSDITAFLTPICKENAVIAQGIAKNIAYKMFID